MKYNEAWANIARKNVNLKVALCLVTVCLAVLCYSTVSLSLKEPLIIERSCFSKPIKLSDKEKSPDEVKAFIKQALEQRFNINTCICIIIFYGYKIERLPVHSSG